MADGSATPVPGRVTFANAPAILEGLAAALEGGARDFDLSGCAEFDSALVAVLLELDRRARRAGGAPMRALRPSRNLLELAALYGVQGILFDERN